MSSQATALIGPFLHSIRHFRQGSRCSPSESRSPARETRCISSFWGYWFELIVDGPPRQKTPGAGSPQTVNNIGVVMHKW